MNKCGSDLQVRPSAIQELETLQEGPLVLAHDVTSEGARRTTLPPDGVYEDGLSGFKSFLNEFKDCVRCLILWISRVQQNLKNE